MPTPRPDPPLLLPTRKKFWGRLQADNPRRAKAPPVAFLASRTNTMRSTRMRSFRVPVSAAQGLPTRKYG